MSSIEKLSIRGMRSFYPGRDETIDFKQPLTVILGANGCGKTTIIECLKMSCTGILPPDARSGRSFVHDPKIRGDVEVKGSVRLQFTSRRGHSMLVQRTYRLQQLQKNVKFTAMDGVVRMVNEHGEKVSINQKCGELDKHIPDLLGVSRAVLECVIFCHQEDSNWPLQEGAVLKRRFDDIFGSSRYTKALTALQTLKKERAAQAKELKATLDVINVHVEQVRVLEEKLESRRVKLETLKLDTSHLSDNIDGLENHYIESKNELTRINALHLEYNKMNSTLALKLNDIQKNYRNDPEFQEMSDTTEQLQGVLSNYDLILKTSHERLEEIVSQESQLIQSRDGLSKRKDILLQDKGRLQNTLEQRKNAIKVRSELASEMGRNYAFGSFLSLNTREELQEFWKLFQDTLTQKGAVVKKLEQEYQANEDEWTAKLSQLTSKVHHCTKLIEQKNNEVTALKREENALVAKIQANHGSLEGSTASSQRELTQLEAKLVEAESKLQAQRENNTSALLREQSVAIEKELHALNFELQTIQSQVNCLRNFEKDQLSIDHKKNEIQSMKDSIDDGFRLALFEQVLGHPITENSLSDSRYTLETCIQNRKSGTEEKKRALKKLESNMTSLELRKQQEESKLAQLRDETEKMEQGPIPELLQIFAAHSLQPETALQQMETIYLEAKDKTVSRKNTVLFLKAYKKKGEKENCCPLCQRGMSGDELELFSKLVAEKMDDSKNQVKILKAEQFEQQMFDVWKRVEVLMPQWKKHQSNQADLPIKSRQLNDLYTETRSLDLELSQAKLHLEQSQVEYEQAIECLNALRSLQLKYDQYVFELKRLNDSESHLKQSIVDQLGQNPPTLQEAIISFEKKQIQCKDLESKNKSIQKEYNTVIDSMSRLQSELHSLREEKHRLAQRNMEVEKSKNLRDALREKLRALQEELAALHRDLPELQRESQIKSNERTLARQQKKLAVEVGQKEHSRCQQDFNQVRLKHDEVERMLQVNIDGQLEKLIQEVKHLQAQDEQVTRNIDKMGPEKHQAQKSLSETESFKRQIRKNIDFRVLMTDIEREKEVLQDFRQRLAQCPSIDAAEQQVKDSLQNLTIAKENRAKLEGRQDNLLEMVREVEINLGSKDYDNIDERKRHRLIEYETTMMVVSDLDKYYKALNISLMEFHSKKIEEINAIIRSLWQITYRGQDIDTIEILSGNEEGSGTSHRSYNYRVVMRKDNAVLDMRGRCSAGQKVLAGLVIRLALAETFCLNCGILALDEPTTNLDTANKMGLAQAISDILIAREKQQNFQLICITHDEEFVQMLNRSQMLGGSRPEYYWTVSREEIAPRYFVSKIDKRPWSSDFVYRPSEDI